MIVAGVGRVLALAGSRGIFYLSTIGDGDAFHT